MAGDEGNTKQGKHRQICKFEIKRTEAAVQRTPDAIKGWLNPFNMADKDKLCVISSGVCVSLDAERDVLRSGKMGKETKLAFIEERLKNTKGSAQFNFFDKIPKMKLVTVEKTNKQVKLTTSQGNEIKYQGDMAF